MDDDIDELIDQLCTRVGVKMEDASFIALTTRGLDRDARGDMIEKLVAVSHRVTALLVAAKALLQ